MMTMLLDRLGGSGSLGEASKMILTRPPAKTAIRDRINRPVGPIQHHQTLNKAIRSLCRPLC